MKFCFQFFFFLITSFGVLHAQNHSIQFVPSIGYQIHSQHGLRFRTSERPFMLTPLQIGLNVYLINTPYSLSFQDSKSYTLGSFDKRQLLGQIWEDTYLLFRYKLKSGFQPEVGIFRMRWENSLGPSIQKGIVLGVSKRINNINVEIKHKILLGFFGPFNQLPYLSFSRELGHPLLKGSKNKKSSAFRLNGIVGARLFSTKKIKKLIRETFHRTALMGSYGVELTHKQSKLAIFQETDVWIALNALSASANDNALKGFIATTTYGLRYHHLLRNKRYLRYGLGYSMIRDKDKVDVLNAEPLKHPFFVRRRYQAQGISTSMSYQIQKHADLEIKNTFIINGADEPFFNSLRLSVGLIYRI